jgi:hypothetical protein
MSNAKTNEEQNKLFEQTEAQRNTRLAKPQDFVVTTASEGLSKSLPGHGQRGDSLAEHKRLLKEAATGNASKLTKKGQPLATEVHHAKKPHTK